VQPAIITATIDTFLHCHIIGAHMRTPLPRTSIDHRTRVQGAHLRAVALALAVAGAAAFAPATAGAQDTRPCTEIENDRERLACYDRALRPNPSAAAPQRPEPPSGRTDEARAERRAAPQAEREPRDTAAPRAAPAPAAPPAAAAPAAGSTGEEEGLAEVLIVAVRALPGRNAVFTTESGDVWIQTDSARLQMPDTPFRAQIKSGAMGSRFLVPTERGRAVRVRPRE
jgi:hypothetical protein